MKYIILILSSLFVLTFSATAQENKNSDSVSSHDISLLLSDFTSSNWGKVRLANKKLLGLGKESIPYLLELMNAQKRYVKLKNTNDLIYPGATEFYGHGFIVPYDIDWIAIRAGWALESLTFQKFGFMEASLTEQELLELHKENYAEYLNKGFHDVNFKKASIAKLNSSIQEASKWWAENEIEWNELKGIKDALYCEETTRQIDVLSHLRYPYYLTVGMSEEYYKQNLRLRVAVLANSESKGVSTQAKLLLKGSKLPVSDH